MRATLAVFLVVSAAVPVAADSASAYLYYAGYNTNSIGRANLDGTNNNAGFITGAGNQPVGIAPTLDSIYWAAENEDSIWRADLDGTDATIVNGPIGLPRGMAANASHIYWVTDGESAVYRADLDGTNATPIIAGQAQVWGLAIDQQYVYWTISGGRIGRANLDGSNPNPNFITGTGGAYGLAVTNDYIYWGNGDVARADIDGTNVDLGFVTLGVGTFGVAADLEHIYWTNAFGGAVGRSDLDGTNVDQTFLTGLPAVFGVALDPAVAEVSPAGKAFGDVPVGQSSSDQTFTVTNTGIGDLGVDGLSVAGVDAASFSIQSDGCTDQVITEGNSCTFDVRFSPDSIGAKTAEVDLDSNSQSRPSIDLSGTGIAAAASISPSSKDFGDVATGYQASQVFDVTNTGNADLEIDEIGLYGANVDQFGLDLDGTNCESGPVEPSDSCTIEVFFAPHSLGAKSAELVIGDNAADSPQSVALSGTGVEPEPAVAISPSSKDFGDLALGSQLHQTFVVTNEGTADLEVQDTGLYGPNFEQFSLDLDGTTCENGPVAPSATCTVEVVFEPDSVGAKTAELQLSDNAPDSPQSVALSGTGVEPEFSVSPTSEDYGDVLVGGSSDPQTFTVTNTGVSALNISDVSLTGVNPNQFSKSSDTCDGTAVAPSGTCTVDVAFIPTTLGAKSANLRFTDDASDSPQDVPLSGTGLAPEFSVSPLATNFGSITLGGSASQAFTVTNTGNSDLTISSVAIDGSFAFSTLANTCLGSAIAPSAGCAVTVQFAPIAAGADSATLSFVHNGADSPSVVALSGSGQAAPAPPAPLVNPPAVLNLEVSAKKPRKATKKLEFRFQVSEPATIKLVVQRKYGRRHGNGCKPTRPETRLGKRCAIYRDAETKSVNVAAGANTITLNAKRFHPGAYRVTLTATTSGGTSAPARLIFYRPWW